MKVMPYLLAGKVGFHLTEAQDGDPLDVWMEVEKHPTDPMMCRVHMYVGDQADPDNAENLVSFMLKAVMKDPNVEEADL